MRTTLRKTTAKRQPSNLQNTVGRGSTNQPTKSREQSKALSSKASSRRSEKVTKHSMKIDHYTFRVSWSPEDSEYIGTCVEFPSLSHLDASPEEAFQGIRNLVNVVIRDLVRQGEAVPDPISDRPYSGAFKVRVPPALHRRLVIEAAEEGVSLNRLVSAKLAGLSEH